MTTHSTSAEREQTVVPLKSLVKPTSKPHGEPNAPRACVVDLTGGGCLEFAQSRRTGNIELTLTPAHKQEAPIDSAPRKTLPTSKAMPKAPDWPSVPHAAMPTASGDFCQDLEAIEKLSPMAAKHVVLEDLMGMDAAVQDSAGRQAARAVALGGAELGLAQIVEAWPQLSQKTRAAMLALLEHAGGVKPVCVPSRRRPRKSATPRS